MYISNLLNLLRGDIILIHYLNIINRNYCCRRYKYLMFRLHCKIVNSTTPIDLIHALRYITFWFNCMSTDELSNVLMQYFQIYPLNDNIIHKLSLWQQVYQNDVGIYSFTTTIFWICYIQYVMDNISE